MPDSHVSTLLRHWACDLGLAIAIWWPGLLRVSEKGFPPSSKGPEQERHCCWPLNVMVWVAWDVLELLLWSHAVLPPGSSNAWGDACFSLSCFKLGSLLCGCEHTDTPSRHTFAYAGSLSVANSLWKLLFPSKGASYKTLPSPSILRAYPRGVGTAWSRGRFLGNASDV